MFLTITIGIFALLGLVLGGGGAQLAALGGSLYYLIAGVVLLATAVLLFLRRAEALWLYGLFILGSLIWALWEVGLDWWQLGTRGGLVVVLGLWLMLPWVRRRLGPEHRRGRVAASVLPLAVPVLIAVITAGISLFSDPYDRSGSLPTDQVAAAPSLGGDVPDGDWHQYGRTPYGQR
jgi:quinoprotein glucose dehydrogenase